MKKPPTAEKLAEWRTRAEKKHGIVPAYFEVFPTKVIIVCGNCSLEYRRNLIPNLDEPIFVCPEENCRARNWVPIRFDLK